ncbi:MAG TPA: ferritin-like domain-containing protein [Acidimicrobiales bacterium]|nr:ferritin-like domain-containing protein [Acidimicrobiales bacterium]
MSEETPDMEHGSHIESLAATAVSRRRFLAGSTVAAGFAILAVACGDDDDGDDTSAGTGGQTNDTTPTTAAGANTDLDTAAAAAGLEKLAFDTYTAAGQLATGGKLGTVPPAVATFVTTAAAQHQEALNAWNRVLTAGGRQAVNTPTAALKPTVDAAAGKLTDIPGTATLALRLEDYASQTYQKVIPTLKSGDAIKLAAQINVVGQQHQAILRYVLGLYPVGSGPAKDTRDFAPSDPQPTLLTG